VNREQFERIANDEIDGIASPEERDALRRHLAGNPEARERFRELQEVVGALDQVALEDPPAHLKPIILGAVTPRARASAPVTEVGFWRSLAAGIFQSVPWREAVPFAAGVGVGVLAIAFVSGNLVGSSRDDLANLRGTMVPQDANRGTPVMDSKTLSVAGATVVATAHGNAPEVVLELEVRPAPAGDTEVEIASRNYRARDLRIDPPGAGDATVGPTGIRIGHRAGEGTGKYVLHLHHEAARPARLEIVVRSGGQSVRAELTADLSGSVEQHP
jgi:hypothetical protein